MEKKRKTGKKMLSDEQFEFLKDISKLINYCILKNIKITGGELYRTDYQHAENVRTGKSKTKRSKHQDRLAIDLNFFIDGHPFLIAFKRFLGARNPLNACNGREI